MKLTTRVIRSDVEGRHEHLRERDYQRRYAERYGYFWLPCVLCGEEFGGHESGGSIPAGDVGFTDGVERRHTICPTCTAERQQKAEQMLRRLDVEPETTSWMRWGRPGNSHGPVHRVPFTADQ
jgi:hypothetical protein